MPSKIEPMPKEPALEPALVTIRAGAQFLAVSPAQMYRLMGLKKIEAVKAGKRTLLKVSSLKAHAESLPVAQIKPPTPRKRTAVSKATKRRKRLTPGR
jgi:hypothetical protein